MPTSTDKLKRLCHGVRAIAPTTEIQLKPSETEPEHWAVMVVAGAAILIHTDFAPLDQSLDQACVKLASISTRMMAAVRQSDRPPPPDTEKE